MPSAPMIRNSLRVGILSVFLFPNIYPKNTAGDQFMFLNECSLFCCSLCLCHQGLEQHLWQPDWELHLSGIRGNFLSCAPLPGHVSRLCRPGSGAADAWWDRSQMGWGKWGIWGAGVGKAWGGRMAGYLDWKEGSARKVRHRPLFPTTGTIENLGWISLWCGWQSCELTVFVFFLSHCTGLEMNPCTYGLLIYDKGDKNIQWRRQSLQ